MATTAEAPKRSLYKAAEVCTIADVRPYVLKSWETEFPNLGVVKGSIRVYRKADVETVLEIKRLLYEEGLTLGAARRKLDGSDDRDPEHDAEPSIAELFGQDARDRISAVRNGLRSVLEMLSSGGHSPNGFMPEPAGDAAGAGAPTPASGRAAKPRATSPKSRRKRGGA